MQSFSQGGTMQLKNNQSALIIETSDDGEVTVDVTSPDIKSFGGRLCIAIGKRIMNDDSFQNELIDMMEKESRLQ